MFIIVHNLIVFNNFLSFNAFQLIQICNIILYVFPIISVFSSLYINQTFQKVLNSIFHSSISTQTVLNHEHIWIETNINKQKQTFLSSHSFISSTIACIFIRKYRRGPTLSFLISSHWRYFSSMKPHEMVSSLLLVFLCFMSSSWSNH